MLSKVCVWHARQVVHDSPRAASSTIVAQVEAAELAAVPTWHRLVLPARRGDSEADGANRAESLIWLADRLLASNDPAVRTGASRVYVTVSR